MLRSRIPEIAAELKPAVDEAIKAAAETIAGAAKDRVPVRTGRLQRAIHTETAPEGTYVLAGDNEAWYGHLVEHGTSHSPPEPFLIPAEEENRAGIEASIGEALHKVVE